MATRSAPKSRRAAARLLPLYAPVLPAPTGSPPSSCPFHRCPMLGHIARAAREPPTSLGAPKSRRAAALLPPPLAPAPPAPRRPPALLLPNRIDAPRPGISYVPPCRSALSNPALPPAVCRRSARPPLRLPVGSPPPSCPISSTPHADAYHASRPCRSAPRNRAAPPPFCRYPSRQLLRLPTALLPSSFPTHLTPHTRASLTCLPCHSAPSNPAPPLAVCRRSAPAPPAPRRLPAPLLPHFFDVPRRGISYVPPASLCAFKSRRAAAHSPPLRAASFRRPGPALMSHLNCTAPPYCCPSVRCIEYPCTSLCPDNADSS
ncbi:hypothetical protein B0H10DRAFT_2442012 [Mycena sp. CBHHK59/15]|nr:hypothetical protein B0H10DRAFT_2442012 [Mycena sp. CBHHK59/15]